MARQYYPQLGYNEYTWFRCETVNESKRALSLISEEEYPIIRKYNKQAYRKRREPNNHTKSNRRLQSNKKQLASPNHRRGPRQPRF